MRIDSRKQFLWEYETKGEAKWKRKLVLQEQFAQLLAQEKITQENIDTFYALVDHAQKPDYPTEPIEQIILEEMAAYLDGAIDEKTTAERIQSRVSLYLMEQKVEWMLHRD